MNEIIATQSDPDVARFVLLHLLEAERGHQHLTGSLFGAVANRTQTVADERDAQNKDLNGGDPVGEERTMIVAIVQFVRTKKLDGGVGCGQRTPGIVEHTIQYLG